MQRQFGKILNKGPGENAKVAVLLNDYEDADHVLSQVGNSRLTHGAIAPVAVTLTLSIDLDHRQREDVEGFVDRSYQHPIASCDRV
jgi:hypothetical protein